MGKKLLVIFGIVALTGYLFRDRIAAGALALVEKANSLSQAVGDHLFVDDESEGDDLD
jgi:hypothetical protein